MDNHFDVSWSAVENADVYILEEAASADFSGSVEIYRGPGLAWSAYDSKTPRAYYYRVRGINQYNVGEWSAAQSVVVYPLFMGLNIRWDGTGYIHSDTYTEVGYHYTASFDLLSEPDTLRASWTDWYDPDPYGWGSMTWYSYYSPTTGVWKSSSTVGDPAWKWADPFILSYWATYTNGTTVLIDGQKFTVTGPTTGTTTFGKTIHYWQFVNKEKFLYWDGGDWKQYLHPGDAVLRYDADGSGLELYSSVMRRDYYKGSLTSDTVQYIVQLTSATSIPESPPFSGLGSYRLSVFPEVTTGQIQIDPRKAR
ncbi:MAG TPA: hypothetical protein VMT46_01595 [Anaerolineaceae bacterium]|nr:hypothetical protein [Anaerolineaceae bacterium]